MEKTVKDYIPKKDQTTMIQGRVPSPIAQDIRAFLEKNNLSWSELITACFKKLLDDLKKEKTK